MQIANGIWANRHGDRGENADSHSLRGLRNQKIIFFEAFGELKEKSANLD